MINALSCIGFRWRSTKLNSGKERGHALDHRTITHSGGPYIQVATSQITLFLQEMENKSNASVPSIVNKQKTNLPLLVSSSEGQDERTKYWIGVIAYDGVDGNIRGNSTTSNFTKAKGCLRDPESTHAKSIFVWNGITGFTAHCPRSPDTR